MLTRWRCRGQTGSGMAIGVAMIFPMLMLVIVSLQMLTETSRIEQALQATANRAARTASLCCYLTGGPDGAEEVVHASLRSAESVNAYNRVFCNNDFVGDSSTIFIDVNGDEVPVDPQLGRAARGHGLRVPEVRHPAPEPGRLRLPGPQRGTQDRRNRLSRPVPIPGGRMISGSTPLPRPEDAARPPGARRQPEGGPSRRRRLRKLARADDQRGDYAIFIAVIASSLLFLGGLAYDGPRLIAARQDAVHVANEAARVAAATIASGGTLEQAREAAEERVGRTNLIYGQDVHVAFIDCVGSRVQVTIITGYIYRSVMGLVRDRQPIEAVGAAQAYLVLPSDEASTLHYLGECPLT